MNPFTLYYKPNQGKQSSREFRDRQVEIANAIADCPAIVRAFPVWTSEHVAIETIIAVRDGMANKYRHARRFFDIGPRDGVWQSADDPYRAEFWRDNLYRLEVERELLGVDESLADVEPTEKKNPCSWLKGGPGFEILGPLPDTVPYVGGPSPNKYNAVRGAVMSAVAPLATYVFPGFSNKQFGYPRIMREMGHKGIATPYGQPPGKLSYFGDPPINTWCLFVGPTASKKDGIITPEQAMAFDFDTVRQHHPDCEPWMFCNGSKVLEVVNTLTQLAGGG